MLRANQGDSVLHTNDRVQDQLFKADWKKLAKDGVVKLLYAQLSDMIPLRQSIF